MLMKNDALDYRTPDRPADASLLGTLRPAFVSFAVLTLLCGVAYPLLVTAVARVAFAEKAGGSLVVENGVTVGSELIAQPFADPKHFWPRPSAAGANGYDAASGSGSNYGPNHPALIEAVATRVAALRAADPGNAAPVPVELVTASGSGLDPHLSPAAAEYQVARVARARGVDEATVRAAVARRTEPRTLGFLGEPRVNVLLLNRDLDAAK